MLVRVPIVINFVLLLLLIGHGSSRKLYLVSNRAGVADLTVHALQIWVVGATVFATAMFVWRRFKRSHAEAQQPPKDARLDGMLLLTWWVVLILACLYAFNMGMGG